MRTYNHVKINSDLWNQFCLVQTKNTVNKLGQELAINLERRESIVQMMNFFRHFIHSVLRLLYIQIPFSYLSIGFFENRFCNQTTRQSEMQHNLNDRIGRRVMFDWLPKWAILRLIWLIWEVKWSIDWGGIGSELWRRKREEKDKKNMEMEGTIVNAMLLANTTDPSSVASALHSAIAKPSQDFLKG